MKLNTKQLNKKLFLFIGIGVAFIALIGAASLITSLLKGKNMSYSNIELEMTNAAKEYYKKHKSALPIDNGSSVTIDSKDLINNGYLNSFDKLRKNAQCSGEVTVTKNDEFYYYAPSLDCRKDYQTVLLVDKITAEKNVVTEGDGLYYMSNNYIFRGEKVNNYVKFANHLWYILRVKDDNSIRLLFADKLDKVVWDDRYNIDRKSTVGINTFEVSRIRDSLHSYYNNPDFFTDNDKAKMLPQTLCIGKRDLNETINDSSIECSEVTEEENIGLLQVNEYQIISLDTNCTTGTQAQCKNYNYLTKLSQSSWSITTDANTSYKAFKLSGSMFLSNASSSATPRFVVELNGGIRYTSGDGSKEKPYVIS